MVVSGRNSRPRRLVEPQRNYVPNEVVLTALPKARNDDLPHYLDVARNASIPATSYGDASVDAVFQHLGIATRSIARTFIPRRGASKLAKALSESTAPTGGPSLSIEANYSNKEHSAGLSRTYKVTFESDVDVLCVCGELSRSKAVENARPNYIRQACAIPNDTFYGFQWGLQAINAEKGWDIETGSTDVLIAIVDSGVDLDHGDLAAKLTPGFDFVDYQGSGGWRYDLLGDYMHRDPHPDDEDGHGTHCAGIAAAASDNNEGVAGVCWNARILPVRVMFRIYDRWKGVETSVGTDVDIDAGIKFAVDSGADVINLSLGSPDPSHGNVLDYAFDNNVCVIAATGNENTNDASYPAANPKTLAVGAVDEQLNRAGFSNYGPNYNDFVMAPGVAVASTYRDNQYVYLDGTSMAAPFVSGLAALIKSLARRSSADISADSVYSLIRESARPLGTGKGDTFFGQGLVDVEAALESAKVRIG